MLLVLISVRGWVNPSSEFHNYKLKGERCYRVVLKIYKYTNSMRNYMCLNNQANQSHKQTSAMPELRNITKNLFPFYWLRLYLMMTRPRRRPRRSFYTLLLIFPVDKLTSCGYLGLYYLLRTAVGLNHDIYCGGQHIWDPPPRRMPA
jgi:hypothetical protein